MSRKGDVAPATTAWLTPEQQRAWLAYIRLQLRLTYEMNRQLQADSGLSLADYDILTALSSVPEGKLQLTDLSALIGWERSRVSHHIKRLSSRGLTQRMQSAADGRATDAILTKQGRAALINAAPGHVDLVRRMFFDPLPERLLAPLTEALERIHDHVNSHSTLPPIPS